MVSDLLNDVVVEMASITLELVTEVESVLHASKDIVEGGDAAALAELKALVLATVVDVLDPGVMGLGFVGVDVILELDDVGAGDRVDVGSIQDRSRVVVDGLGAEGSGRSHGGDGEGDDGLHGDDGNRQLSTPAM